MIIFDGVDIRTVAGVRIDDIKVSGVQLSPVTRPRPIAPGAEFVRNRAAGRTVTVTFVLLDKDINTRQASLDAVSAWAKSDREYKLELPGRSRYLNAVCTEKPSSNTRQWWEKLRIVFSCFSDPFWIGRELSVPCGTPFRVQGDGEPLMRIEHTLTAQATNQSYSDGDKTMTFLTIPAGYMVIDLNRQTAEVGGSSIMGGYVVGSRFIVPKTGYQTITGAGTVKYRERWQ